MLRSFVRFFDAGFTTNAAKFAGTPYRRMASTKTRIGALSSQMLPLTEMVNEVMI